MSSGQDEAERSEGMMPVAPPFRLACRRRGRLR